MEFDEILANLHEIIGDTILCESVYKTYHTAIELIRNGTVKLKLEPRLKTLLNGMNFQQTIDGELYLLFGQKYLDTYSKSSSIHYTILMHELKHLYDCTFSKEPFHKCTEKQKYWYEFAAKYIEVDFIKYYLKDKFTLSRCEEFILYSFENDDLDSFSTLFQRVSKKIYTLFQVLETDYKNNYRTKENIAENLIQFANQLINEYEEPNDDFIKYTNYVRIKSFRNCLEDIALIKDGGQTILFNEIYNGCYPYLHPIYTKLYEIIDTYNEKK